MTTKEDMPKADGPHAGTACLADGDKPETK